MGQVRHKYVTAAHAITVAIQRSQAITAARSWEPGITVKSVAKWRKCETVEDRKTRLTHPSSMVLKADEEAMIVAFRRHTRLPTDDCLYALQPTIPHLTRSSLYRCWAAAWNIATSRDGRRQAQTAKVQALPYGIFPYRHRRMAHQRR